MRKSASTDTLHTDTAVELNGVTKLFLQSRRGGLAGLFKSVKTEIRALDDISFSVKKGEFAAYAGPNGAGKSTTMKLLSGMLIPNSGRISVLGMSPQSDRVGLMRRLGVLFGNRTELWWDHPVEQSFEWKRVVWNIPDDVYRRNLDMAIDLLDLKPLLKTFARELSLGQRMRCDIAMLLLHSPELILLDEPTLGLDVAAKRQMIEFLKTVNRDDGVTIIVTSHDMDDLEEMAKRILMISAGKIAYDGDFSGLRTLTGSPSHVIVTMNNGIEPDFPSGKLLTVSNGVYEYELDLSKTSVNELMLKLSGISGIKDIEIKKAPIEHVIAELYKEWK